MKLIDVLFESVIDLSETKPLTKDQFVQKAQQVHQNKDGSPIYTYDNVNYVNTDKPVLITCPVHGDFLQTPSNHKRGGGCEKCYRERQTYSPNEFIEKAQKKHRNKNGTPKYTYGNVNYIGSQKNVLITCPVHGDFSQAPYQHLRGRGCDECSHDALKSNTEDFIKRAQKVHKFKHAGPKYTYKNTIYVGSDKPVLITCPKHSPIHGDFSQRASDHLSGNGCPWCNESKGEKRIQKILHEKNINVIQYKKYDDCISYKSKNGLNRRCKKLEFDFYLPDQNTLIEFDGSYHFSGMERRKGEHLNQILNDKEKNEYTKSKGIKLIRISYHDRKDLEEELMKGLDSTEQLYLSTNYPADTGWRSLTT